MRTELDIYGSVKNLHGERERVQFRYPEQYEDSKTELYYLDLSDYHDRCKIRFYPAP